MNTTALIEMIRILLTFFVGYFFCVYRFAHKISNNPDGQFIIEQRDAGKDFMQLDMNISIGEIANKNFVVLKVKNNK